MRGLPSAALAKVSEVVRSAELQLLLQVLRGTCQELVEDVVVALFRALADHPGPFEQVVRDVAAGDLALGVEVDLDELAEPRAVVVPRRLGVAESLQDGIGVQQLLFEGPGLNPVAVAEVLQDVLGRLGLSGSRFSRHDDGLRLLQDLHVPEGLVCDGEDVRRHCAQGLALIGPDAGGLVQLRNLIVRVDCDEDVGHVGVDLVAVVSDPNVVEKGRLGEKFRLR